MNEQIHTHSSCNFGSGLKRSILDSNTNESKILEEEEDGEVKSEGKKSDLENLENDNIFHRSDDENNFSNNDIVDIQDTEIDLRNPVQTTSYSPN